MLLAIAQGMEQYLGTCLAGSCAIQVGIVYDQRRELLRSETMWIASGRICTWGYVFSILQRRIRQQTRLALHTVVAEWSMERSMTEPSRDVFEESSSSCGYALAARAGAGKQSEL
jgi:hypothetical protein